MSRLLCVVLIFFCCSSLAIAIEKSPSVFYPIPDQSQGKIYSAKNLFLGQEGGVWIHDIQGKVRFFDGQHVLPRTGSILPEESLQLTYLNNAFWTFFEGALYKTSTNSQRQLVVSLPAGTSIKNIGSSGRVIWLVSDDFFYTYNIDSHQLDKFSLDTLIHFDKAKQMVINDAKFGTSKWVLATNSGVFISENRGFVHITESGDDYVEKLFFSERRRELLVGTLDGALVVDLEHREREPKKLAKSHVLSMTETDNEYWIGTENGLFVHSLLTGSTKKLKSNVHSDYSLTGRKIFALVNDLQGGIWVACDKGVYYFSLFGQKFSRYLPRQINQSAFGATLLHLHTISGEGDFLLTTSEGVSKLSLDKTLRKEVIYNGPVNDSLVLNQQLWLATETGVIEYDLSTNRILQPNLPMLVSHHNIERIEIDIEGVLWGTSDNKLWSYNTHTKQFVDYGDDWIVDAYLPSVITQLMSTRHNGVFIGTEHGTYNVHQNKIVFNRASNAYGQSNHMLEDSEGNLWFAGDYGIYKQLSGQSELKPIRLAEDNISPKCLMETPQGIWLSTSQGLTLYDLEGEIKKHFSEPYGLINNEFLPGVCTVSQNAGYPLLVIGSTQGIVKVSADELAVSDLPNNPVIVSQIKLDDQRLTVGTNAGFGMVHGSTLSLLFGVLPLPQNSVLEYRLNNNSVWLPIEGSQLTFDHLHPGKYVLHLRSLRSGQRYSNKSELTFNVTDPWYLSLVAQIIYVVLTAGILVSVVWWRSRLIVRANQLLKEQVSLKTSQLRHQSKIVLSNNLQLRKQIQVRHALLENILSAIEPTLEKLMVKAREYKQADLLSLAEDACQELEQVKNIRTDSEQTSLVHNVSMVLDSILDSWKDEFSIEGMKITKDIQCNQSYVELKQFNLDVIFNTLMSETIKRLYRNQTLLVQCYERDAQIIVSMSDQGGSAKSIEQTMTTTSGFTLNQLNDLVSQSGGEMNVFVSKDQNLVQLSWPRAYRPQQASRMDNHEIDSGEVSVDEAEVEWLNKVEHLVRENYSDAEFSTASVVKTLFMSERSFQRRFKAVTGKTFKEFLNEFRLEKACHRLLSGEKVSQVAFECGFNDPSYFSQRFKHYFGLSPTQFIEEHCE